MEISVGIPNNVAHVLAPVLLDWSRAAEARGFSAINVIDRLGYPCFDTLATLSAAAAVTSNIRVSTNILSGPLYEPLQLAKTVSSLALLSGERLTIGIALGGYKDSYDALGLDFGARGKSLERAISTLRDVASGHQIIGGRQLVPTPVHIPIIVGGNGRAVISRIARLGDGWSGSPKATPEQTREFIDEIRQAWAEAGRTGAPKFITHANFAFGDNVSAGQEHLRSYYSALGFGDVVADAMVRTPEQAQEFVEYSRNHGFDEVIFHAAASDVGMLHLLADALL